jgi:hypothetical protein
MMIDTDPVYEQIKYASADQASRAYLDAHTHFFTYGENLGAEDCPVPLCGVPGVRRGRPSTPASGPCRADAPSCFTTIGTWENKGKNIEMTDRICLVKREFGSFLTAKTSAGPVSGWLSEDESADGQLSAGGWLWTGLRLL